MINTEEEIRRRLLVLAGLEVSAVSHAADMLTLHFGPLKRYTTRRGTVLEGGQWALHIQCGWQIESSGVIFATQADFSGSDDDINRTTERINDLLVTSGPVMVESVWASPVGDVYISMSRETRLAIKSDRIAGDEDWRFFSPGSDGKHFVIDGGSVNPYSLS